MGRRPERTCIGCRGVFGKDEVVRFVAGPDGPVIDYRERLPGRAAYVCPRRGCIERALSRGQIPRAFRAAVRTPSPEEFTAELAAAVRRRLAALCSQAAKADRIAMGFSAVEDALQKGRVKLILFSEDCSPGTREKILAAASEATLPEITAFSTAELGGIVGREMISVAAMLDQGFADALMSEHARYKGLINTHA